MTGRSRHAWCAALAAAIGAGCGLSPWGESPTGEPLPASAAISNGLVVALGPQALAVGAARLKGRLDAHGPLTVAGELNVASAQVLTVSWQDAALVPLTAGLTSGPAGLRLALHWQMADTQLALTVAGAPWCEMTVAVDEAVVEGALSLGQDKAGRVQARVLEGAATLGVPTVAVDAGGCASLVAEADLTLVVDTLVARLAKEVLDGLSPTLGSEVPSALGLGLALGATLTRGDDGIGAGSARLRIAAPEGAGAPLWTYSNGNLVVPFTVALAAERHPCVPADALPPVPPLTKIPTLDPVGGGALYVNVAVAQRAMLVVWTSGAACGDHATAGVALPLAELTELWPQLAAFGEGTPLQLRLWPDAQPTLAFSEVAGAVAVTAASERLDVELLAEIDGARVTLASLALELRVTGGLEIDATGGVWLAPTAVEAVTVGAPTAGLIAAPPDAVAEKLAAPLAEALFASHAFWQLPALPNEGGPLGVRLLGDYLGFGPASAPDSP